MKIIYINDQGGVAVITPTPEALASYGIEAITLKDVPAGKPFKIVDAADIPADRTFRNAWEYDKGKVVVSFPKAQEFTKERLRIERIPLLQAQDVLFQRALETGANTMAVVAEKQRLRDITNLVDECTELEQLKALNV